MQLEQRAQNFNSLQHLTVMITKEEPTVFNFIYLLLHNSKCNKKKTEYLKENYQFKKNLLKKLPDAMHS